MAKEEFTIRVTREGELIVETENLPARRVKDLIRYLEETLGPVRLIDGPTDDAGGRVELDDLLERSAEQHESPVTGSFRLRLRNRDSSP